jgi:hypothetical protein
MSKFASAYTIPAFSAYRETALIDRDALTLALAELSARFDATPRRPDPVARHELRLLVLLDQMLRAQAAAVEGAEAAGGEPGRLSGSGQVKRAAIQSATSVVLWKTAPSWVAPSSSTNWTGWL